jgi:Lon-like ATP-dependent protease
VGEVEKETKVDGAQEAESSKAAEERAKAEVADSVKAESATGASAASAGAGDKPAGGENDGKKPKESKEVAKPSIPEVYPQVLALPITRRPLFPGELRCLLVYGK